MRRSLEGTEGVVKAVVSYKQDRAWIIVDGSAADPALEEAVGRAGSFTGKIISREPFHQDPSSFKPE
ncbi:MAG: hypothetical protein V3S63_06150 [bacterium]